MIAITAVDMRINYKCCKFNEILTKTNAKKKEMKIETNIEIILQRSLYAQRERNKVEEKNK